MVSLLLPGDVPRGAQGVDQVLIPQVDGEWWTIVRDPDLGPLTSSEQQPVDFAIWQAADGTWQLWSCIRKTKCPGKTRLFYRWQCKNLTDSDWEPMGIALQADPGFGETPCGLLAPYVLKINGVYHLFYGDWEHICLATGVDGKTFARQLDVENKSGMFGEGPGAITRDPMVLPVGKQFYCFYTAHPNKQGAVYCRVSQDLRSWRKSKIVASGGSAGTGPSSAECPFVHFHRPSSAYYLFRTQRYGVDARTSVYRSKDPLSFGINDDSKLVCVLPVAAPEIIESDGSYYIAALLPSLKGIQVARLKWGVAGRK